MKHIILIVLSLCLLSCGNENSPETQAKLAYRDSLLQSLSKNVNSVSAQGNMIDLTADEGYAQYDPQKSGVTLKLPTVDGKSPSVVDIHLEFKGDSLSKYKITAGRSLIPEPKGGYYIQPGDTKQKIADRLGVNISQIKNTPPLKVGDKVLLE